MREIDIPVEVLGEGKKLSGGSPVSLTVKGEIGSVENGFASVVIQEVNGKPVSNDMPTRGEMMELAAQSENAYI